MRFFLKILFLLFILTVLAAVIAYPFYKAPILEKTRVFVSEELSSALDSDVNITSISLLSFSSISLEKVKIEHKTESSGIINIENVTISIDPVSFIKNKQLLSTIKAKGINTGQMSCDILLRTTSLPADTYKEALSPDLIDSVFIIESRISSGDISLDNLIGTLDIENMAVTGGNLSLKYKNSNYLIEFSPYFQFKNAYNISVRSKDISLISTISYDKKRLIINETKGSFYTLDFNLEGKIDEFLSKERSYFLKGIITADLETFSSEYDRIDGLDIKVPLSGTAKLKFELKADTLDIEKIKITSLLYVDYVDIGKIHIDSISSKIYLDNGRVNIPELKGYLYNGTFSADAKINIEEKSFPFTMTLDMSDISLEAILKDFEYKKRDIYGYCTSELTLEGWIFFPESYNGYWNIEIVDGNLGPMPVLTPLLGNLFGLVRKQLMPDNDKVNINQAFGTFSIKDKKISTDDAILWGSNIAITGEGYMDFNGKLDFTLQNKFTQTPIEEIENWQTAFRNSIIRLGKAMGKARLKGTIMNPKWDFDYFPKK